MSLDRDREFEDRLRLAQPINPSALLEERIEAALQARERRKAYARIRTWAAWGGLAVAATLMVSFGVLLFNGRLELVPPQPEAFPVETAPSTAKAADSGGDFRPVVAENNLKSRIDEGIVFLRNGLTARRYRYEFVDRVVWQNPEDGAIIEMEIPRDEVVLVPVQTF